MLHSPFSVDEENLTAQVQTKLDVEQFKSLCKGSLEFLCKEVLWRANPPHEKAWDKVHDDIERLLYRPSRRKLLLVPRGHLKTALQKAYCIQTLLKNPNARILIANQVWDKSREMLYEIKEYLTTKSILPQVFGSFESGRWTQDEIVIRQRTKALAAASIATTGVEAETVSSHYDLIVLDDIQGLTNCQTQEQRDKVKRYYRAMIDLVEQMGTIIVIGTRWHLDDIYAHILENEKDYYEIMVRKVVEDGKIIFPSKFQAKMNPVFKNWEYSPTPSMEYIDYLKRSKGSEFFSQYMNDPIDEENQLFKKSYFRYWQRRPEGLYVGMTVDLAIGQKQENDYTAITVCGKDNRHNIYVLDYLRGHWRPSDVVEKIFEMRSKWSPSVVGMEVNGFQKTLQYGVQEEMRRRQQHFPISEIRNNVNSKEFRIKALEPYYRNNAESQQDSGRIYHAEWMKDKDLELELMAYPRAKHDDISDALSMQLDLLAPGASAPREEIKAGSYAYFEREARQRAQGPQGFFNYGI